MWLRRRAKPQRFSIIPTLVDTKVVSFPTQRIRRGTLRNKGETLLAFMKSTIRGSKMNGCGGHHILQYPVTWCRWLHTHSTRLIHTKVFGIIDFCSAACKKARV